MNKLLAMLCVVAVSFAGFSGCKTVGGRKILRPNGKIKKAKINKDFDIKVKLIPNTNPGEVPKAEILVINKKTKKQWIFTHKEFRVLIKSWKNWKLVSKMDPVISNVEQDRKYYYITFNYYNKSDDGRVKESVLSGQIIISKKYVENKTKIKMLIGTVIGLAVYSLLMTILVVIFAL